METKFEERTLQFFDAVDEIFDVLVGKTLTFIEALGIEDAAQYPDDSDGGGKGWAVNRVIKTLIREAQNEIKDKYPNFKDLK